MPRLGVRSPLSPPLILSGPRHAPVAQRIERQRPKLRVGGSSPSRGTILSPGAGPCTRLASRAPVNCVKGRRRLSPLTTSPCCLKSSPCGVCHRAWFAPGFECDACGDSGSGESSMTAAKRSSPFCGETPTDRLSVRIRWIVLNLRGSVVL